MDALTFAYDGRNIKMLEYNADTPTGLLEASSSTMAMDRTSIWILNRDH